jgi:TRAP-type uncharacterized transport system substrate-binding protein
MRHALAGVLCGLLYLVSPAFAAAPVTVGLMADTREDFALAMRLAAALDHQARLRVMPIAGKGPVQSFKDLVYLKGVDAVLIPSDVLAFAVRNGLYRLPPSKVSFLVNLGHLDVHLVARGGIASLAALAGKRVATGSTRSWSYVASHLILGLAGIAVEDAPLEGQQAVAALAEGSIDAAFLVGPKPLPELAALKSPDLHLVPLEAPAEAADAYAPVLLTAADYPGLIGKGQTVESVSSALLIAAFEWPRGSPQAEEISAFTAALFAAFQGNGSGAADINLAASVAGWQRARVAEDLLKSRAAGATPQ